MKLIDKDALVAEIERKIHNIDYEGISDRNIGQKQSLYHILYFLDTLEVKEVSEELAETYMQVFEKKFPILPTLKSKQLDKFKNFLNRCRQIFGLQEFGIHPVQAKLFEKLALLWAAWGAKNLQEIGQMEGEPDVVKEVNSIWNDAHKTIPEDSSNQIICIKEDGLAVLTVGKIVNGTKKWAYLNDLVDTDNFNIEVEESDLNPIFEEMGVEPDSKIAMAFRNAFYKGVDNFCKRKENKI